MDLDAKMHAILFRSPESPIWGWASSHPTAAEAIEQRRKMIDSMGYREQDVHISANTSVHEAIALARARNGRTNRADVHETEQE